MSKKELDRKQAIKKLGKYAAFTALGTFMLLNPKKAQSQSPPPPGEFGQKMKKLFYQFSRRIDKDLFILWFEKPNKYLIISESQKEIIDLFNKSKVFRELLTFI